MTFDSTYQNKPVLVTGHKGFKGSWLCEWLLKMGADVVGLALVNNQNTKNNGLLCRVWAPALHADPFDARGPLFPEVDSMFGVRCSMLEVRFLFNCLSDPSLLLSKNALPFDVGSSMFDVGSSLSLQLSLFQHPQND